MKHFKHLFTLLLLCIATVATAHDFEVDGIYYNITDATAKTVAVTYRGSSYSSYSNEYSGTVNIPATVNYNNATYSVTSIGDYAFRECSCLSKVYSTAETPAEIGYNTFKDCKAILYVPTGRKEAYLSAEYWKDFTNIVEMDFTGIDDVTTENNGGDEWYDLNGRSVDYPTKGIYTRNGKKVVY